MTKIVCAPPALLPAVTTPGVDYFALYSNPGRPEIGTVASGWPDDLERKGLFPPVRVWDFVSLALSVAAADLSCSRAGSADGWTRVIELDVCLHEPAPWVAQSALIESALRFLTGDFWTLNLLPGGEPPPQTTAPVTYDADCVSLLSGGIDSLVGAIDLTAQDRKPLFVSQMAEKPETQHRYARTLGGETRHFQWNHRINLVHASERSTRGRSIVFFAYAALAASVLRSTNGHPVEVFVPENGFISLNLPLNPGRLGSLSTKTTHPVFLSRIQAIWNAVGINAVLRFPYRFITKGELLLSCADQDVLQRLVGDSISCGRFKTFKHTHCGRCVPCLVRRAAFLKAGIQDSTPHYYFHDLSTSGRESGSNDIGAAATAYLRYQADGVRRFAGGALAFAPPTLRSQYEGVVERGMEELGQLLSAQGVI